MMNPKAIHESILNTIIGGIQNFPKNLKKSIDSGDQKKLAKTRDNKVASATIPNGTRAFKGTFVGNKVDIFVYYDTKTKVVYRTKAVVSGVSKDIAEQEYSKVKNLLSQKYVSDFDDIFVGTQGGKESVSFVSANDEGEINGLIDLFITQDEETWVRAPYYYNLHIDYNDRINTNNHENQQLDEI